MKTIVLITAGIFVASPADANPLLRLLFGSGARSSATGAATNTAVTSTATRSAVANSAYRGAYQGSTQASRNNSFVSGAAQLYQASSQSNQDYSQQNWTQSNQGYSQQNWSDGQQTHYNQQPVQRAAPQMVQRRVYVGREILGTCWDPYVGAWRTDYRDVYRTEWVPAY
jgi:hypothetical protein